MIVPSTNPTTGQPNDAYGYVSGSSLPCAAAGRAPPKEHRWACRRGVAAPTGDATAAPSVQESAVRQGAEGSVEGHLPERRAF